MKQISPFIFRAYDIRGRPGKDFEPQDVQTIGRAFGTYMRNAEGKNLLVGRDNRFTSDELSSHFIRGLLSTGCNVIDVGLVLKPILQVGIKEEGFDGGAMVTGSHNPPEYNGFKFFEKEALPVFGENIQTIKDLVYSENFAQGEGKLEYGEIFDLYASEVEKRIEDLSSQEIVLDCGNGTASRFAPLLFHRLGCKVVKLYCRLDGSYPYHIPDPEDPLNLSDLRKKVKEEGADLGLALDTDGDRIGVVDEKGEIVESEHLLVILARDILSRAPGSKVLFDIKASFVLEKEIERAGGVPVMMKTGHPYFQERMAKNPDILLGGEVSGHTFVRENYFPIDDALFAGATLLEVLTRKRRALSSFLADIPETFHTEVIKAPCPDKEKFRIAQEVGDFFRQKYSTIDLDGTRVLFSPSSWALIRVSHTTPALALRFEARKKEEFEKIIDLVRTKLEDYPEVDLSTFEEQLK